MKDISKKVLAVIDDHEKNGDVYHDRTDIIARVQGSYPEITEDEINMTLIHLSQDGYLIRIDDDYCVTETHYAEDQAARQIAEIIRHNEPPTVLDAASALAAVEAELGFRLSSGQHEAIRGALGHRMSIITGGPGTGKTTVLKVLCDAFVASGDTGGICLMAPTGKAARRLSEQTRRPAATVHSILQRLDREDSYLASSLVVVDEASMLSITLLYDLLKVISSGARLVLVGDPDQLPAVGPGRVLADLMASGLPTYWLQSNFRQSCHSLICEDLKLIKERTPALRFNSDEILLLETMSSQDTEYLALSIYLALRAEHGNQVQMLTPVGPAGGVCSARQFNCLAQDHINPHAPDKLEVVIDGTTYRLGDRVIQLQNNSFARNGDIGTIVGIVGDSSITIQIRFDFMEDGVICYPLRELEGGLIQLAYALTIHKAQGSEYDYVVIPLANEHVFSWSNNMIYTAISRAKKRVVLVGSRWLLEHAIQTSLPPCRSEFAEKIRRYLAEPAA